jgi:glycosyltransferase involved in cell wall biosynthesis
MNPPKVSVFIPVYNGKRFLAECIESVLAQDFTDYELLISDDGSTDGTPAMIERYAAKDQRIRWWINPENLKVAGNFNCCLQACRGELVKPLFADDVLLQPSMLRRMVALLDQQPAVTLVGCASYVIDEQSRPLELRNHFSHSRTWDGKDAIVRCFENTGNIIGEPSLMMFRRTQGRNKFNSRYRQIVDLEFCLHLMEAGQFSYIAEPLAAWRTHPDQDTALNLRRGWSTKEELWLIQEWYAKPWLKQRATRQMLFTQIRHLRRYYGKEADVLTTEMLQRLGKGYYAAYWLKRRLTRPFKKIHLSAAAKKLYGVNAALKTSATLPKAW